MFPCWPTLWNTLSEELPKFIIEAEEFANYSGKEKKEFVKTKLAVYALNNKIRFNEEIFDESIDEIVDLTKKVNAREKDRQCGAAYNQGVANNNLHNKSRITLKGERQ